MREEGVKGNWLEDAKGRDEKEKLKSSVTPLQREDFHRKDWSGLRLGITSVSQANFTWPRPFPTSITCYLDKGRSKADRQKRKNVKVEYTNII